MTGQNLHNKHRRVAIVMSGVALCMLGLAFASVPLYRMFCQATGFAGTTQRATKPSATTSNKIVTVRFDGNVSPGLAWEFAPVKRTIDVKLGESKLAVFKARNLSNETITGTASFNVAPEAAGAYFNKLQCFCFTEQTLKPGEEVEMPVTFYVDPEFGTARETRGITQITLSYTFFPKEVEKPAVAVKRGSEKDAGTTGGNG